MDSAASTRLRAAPPPVRRASESGGTICGQYRQYMQPQPALNDTLVSMRHSRGTHLGPRPTWQYAHVPALTTSIDNHRRTAGIAIRRAHATTPAQLASHAWALCHVNVGRGVHLFTALSRGSRSIGVGGVQLRELAAACICLGAGGQEGLRTMGMTARTRPGCEPS